MSRGAQVRKQRSPSQIRAVQGTVHLWCKSSDWDGGNSQRACHQLGPNWDPLRTRVKLDHGKEGSKLVKIAGIDDKRQLIAVFGGTKSGDFLPPQLIYHGKTSKCLPLPFWLAHYLHRKSLVKWKGNGRSLGKDSFPLYWKKRQELKLGSNYPALVIFDRFQGQCTDNIFALLADNHVLVAVVLANCTDRLQPLDVSDNKAAKEFLRSQFQEWYTEQICHQLQEGNESAPQPVDLRMSIVKPLGTKWMISLYDYMKPKPDIIKNGFRHAGITTH